MKGAPMIRRAYTVPMVADMWGISKGKVYQMIERGELGCIRFGRSVRVRPEHIEAYEDEQCISSASRKSTGSGQKSGTSSGRKTDGRIDSRRGKVTG